MENESEKGKSGGLDNSEEEIALFLVREDDSLDQGIKSRM